MIFEPRACDLPLVDVEIALGRAALGDYADEAAVLPLLNRGHWVPVLRAAGLIMVTPDAGGEGMWAAIAWPDLEPALASGRISGSAADVRVLLAAASIADGQPIDWGMWPPVWGGARCRCSAAIAHAAGSNDQPATGEDRAGIRHAGERLPSLVPWPPRE